MTSPISFTSPNKYSIKPEHSFKPKVRNVFGFKTSASTNSTRLSFSAAMLRAKLIAVNVFPSPGRALVTIIMLALVMVRDNAPNAFDKSLRFISRNSSLIWLRVLCKDTNPRRSKSTISISKVCALKCASLFSFVCTSAAAENSDALFSPLLTLSWEKVSAADCSSSCASLFRRSASFFKRSASFWRSKAFSIVLFIMEFYSLSQYSSHPQRLIPHIAKE